MKVLLVGGGGREHALAWRLKKDDPSIDVIAAPGNPGIATLAECVPVPATSIEALQQLAETRKVAYTIVGPEAPLADGIVDRFRTAGLPIFGPTRAAAEIETSKAFSKALMREANVPTARAIICTEAGRAKGAVREFGAPVVIKASGLAAGKGVMVCETHEQADRAIDDMLVGGIFGVAGREILVEEFMTGEELSVLGITDGERVLPLVPAQDHKRLLDGDRGPNTGGMGAYAPVSIATDALLGDIMDRIFVPTLAAMRSKGRPFTGLLYAGVMLTNDGPRVVEFNCRFGDPETQVVLAVTPLPAGFSEVLSVVARGEQLPATVEWPEARGAAVTTVLAAAGYPDKPVSGAAITIPDDLDDVVVFHAGTAQRASGDLVTTGGRVLAVTGIAPSFDDAQRRSRDAAARIRFEGKQYRTDIGWREISRRARAS
ncbi:MAG TPA: phosphoribosylamine--glycine ligase [Gemmatimonadaceae bacterium]|nr:phosphoribosylamine--glycine ligase [Gemmatimonadaceae bacterium]